MAWMANDKVEGNSEQKLGSCARRHMFHDPRESYTDSGCRRDSKKEGKERGERREQKEHGRVGQIKAVGTAANDSQSIEAR